MKKNNTEKKVRQEKRPADVIAIEKSNRCFKIIETQIANLEKAKKNVIKSGNEEVALKMNIALDHFSKELKYLKIDVSKLSAPTEEEAKQGFDFMAVEIPKEEKTETEEN